MSLNLSLLNMSCEKLKYYQKRREDFFLKQSKKKKETLYNNLRSQICFINLYVIQI